MNMLGSLNALRQDKADDQAVYDALAAMAHRILELETRSIRRVEALEDEADVIVCPNCEGDRYIVMGDEQFVKCSTCAGTGWLTYVEPPPAPAPAPKAETVTISNAALAGENAKLQSRIASLEQKVSDTGLLGRVIRRVESLEGAPKNDRIVIDHEVRLKKLEREASAPAPAPEPAAETVTISKAAFVEAIKVLKLALGNPEDETTANRLIHAIGVLEGDIPPMPF